MYNSQYLLILLVSLYVLQGITGKLFLHHSPLEGMDVSRHFFLKK